MGLTAYLGNGLFRASVCASAAVGAKLGSSPEVHNWLASQSATVFGFNLPTIPAIHLPAANYVAAHLPTLAALKSALIATAIPVALVIPVFHYLNWVKGARNIPESVRDVIDDGLLLYVRESGVDFQVDYATRNAISPTPGLPAGQPISLRAHDSKLLQISNDIGVMQGTAPALHTVMSNELTTMYRNLGQRYTVRVPENSGVGFEKVLHELAPEFAYQRYTFAQPHPELATARKVMNALISHEIHRLNKPSVLVGASQNQVASYPNVVHNHAPFLTGRDRYRHENVYPDHIKTFADAVSCRSMFNHCLHAFPETTLVLPFSAPDINIRTVVRSMIENRQHDALILTHIPTPFLDKRINTYTDDVLNVRFERRNGKIWMYPLDGASSGYVNDANNMMSWARSMPMVKGYHVMLEELRSIGTMYLLQLKVAKGAQEEYVSCFRAGKQQFYILPILKPKWRMHKDEDSHYVVPSNRFDNVVSFCVSSGTVKNAFEIVANKVRGQQAEIKIAGQTLMPRWHLTPDQFGSTITHAILKSQIMRMDHEKMWRTGHDFINWWFGTMEGNALVRFKHYLGFIFSLGNYRHTPEMFDDGFRRQLGDKILAAHWQHGRMVDPYAEHGIYRVHHENHFEPELRQDADGFTAPTRPPPPDVLKTFVKQIPKVDYREKREAGMRRDNDFLLHSHEGLIEPGKPASGPFIGVYGRELHRMTMELSKASSDDLWPYPRVQIPVDGAREDDDLETIGGEDSAIVETPGQITPHPSQDAANPLNPALFPSEVAEPTTAPVDEGEESKTLPLTGSQQGDDTTDESCPSESCPPTECSLPGTSAPCAVYEISARLLMQDLHHNGKINFAGPISFIDPPTPSPSQLDFSAQFQSIHSVEASITAQRNRVIPAPDTGLLALLQRLCALPAPVRQMSFNPLEQMKDPGIPSGQGDENEDAEDRLASVINEFWMNVNAASQATGGKYREPHAMLNGIPATSKSGLARMAIKGETSLVVVPTRKLQREWRNRTGPETEVITQHGTPSKDRYSWVVIDEANLLGKELITGWLVIAKHLRCKRVICLGDQFQHTKRQESDATFGASPLRGPQLHLKNSFSLPQDALAAFLAINGLTAAAGYRTLSNVKRSVVILDRQIPDVMDCPGFELYTRSRVQSRPIKDPHGREMISVTQAQGTRCDDHYFTSALEDRQHMWFQDMLSVQSVLFTRHTRKLVIDLPRHHFATCFPKVTTQHVTVINGKSQSKLMSERARNPWDLDTLLQPHPRLGDFVHSAALPLDVSLQYGDVIRTTNANLDRPTVPAKKYLGPLSSIKLATEVLNSRTQHTSRREYKEELDFIAPAAYGLISIGELGWGKDPTMRCHLPGVFNLADIQMARDRFNDLRNLILRQLNEPKGLWITQQDVADAHHMFKLYCRAFMKPEFEMVANGHFSYEYLATRTPAFLASWNDPFGFSAHGMSKKSFLKTQAKVKPGLNGQETHGQEVIANSAEETNVFAAYSRNGYYYMACSDREDFITDTGYSDEELSAKLMHSGIGARIEASGNLQIDLTRQDSTHRPAHVLAYCMFLNAAGVPTEVTDLYLKIRSMSYVKSLAEGLYKAVMKWNLASGDAFTLNANCFMMKCNLAVEYDGLEYCAGIQKGDDFICSNEGWRQSARADMRQRLRYVMKVDVNKPAYHAGRFLHEGVLLADPVRAFYRHFAKTFDPAVSVEDLYRSFVERSVNYTDRQQEYLKIAIPLFYEELSGEESYFVVETINSLRSLKNFKSTYKYASDVKDRVLSPTDDCAYVCAQKLLPHLNAVNLRAFRNHTDPKALAALFKHHGVRTSHAPHPCLLPPGFSGVVISRDHCYAILPPVPATL